SGSGASTSSASWVARLDGRADSLRTAQQPTPSDGGAGSLALGSAIIAGVFAVLILGAALPIAGIRAWRGGFRVGAWLALGLYALPIINIVAGTLIDPTSHNLWPLELLG